MIVSLSAEKRALLDLRLRAIVPRTLQKPRLTPASGGVDLPLSFSQQRFWFLWCLEPDLPEYNTPLALRLHGELDVSVLERAWGEIVRRHAGSARRSP